MKKIEVKKLKVGLYNPFLDTLGGGEKHILSIIDVLVKSGAEATIFWNKNLSQDLEKRFSLQCFKTLKWLPVNLISSSLGAMQTLKSFDLFFYVSNGSYFFSTAKNNFVFCMVPDKKLYNLNLINKIKLRNYKFISNSPYTTKWLKNWNIDPITITPYIDNQLKPGKKEKIILSVGRFFPHLHNKNQIKIIETFKKLKNKYHEFFDYKLILVGGLKDEDKEYFKHLKSLSDDASIIFKPNISLDELHKFYGLSTYYWHFTGLGVDEKNHPDLVEHFGIAPLEATVAGCVVLCHNSGGPKEIFTNEENGVLFENENDLIKSIKKLEDKPPLKNKIVSNGIKLAKNKYNYQLFKNKVLALV